MPAPDVDITDDDGQDTGVVDETQKPVDDSGEEKPSYADDPEYKKMMKTQSALSGLLEKHGFDSIDDLQDLIDEGVDMKSQLGARDFNSILKKADTLDRYEEHWAQEEEQKREEDEDPDDTIKRLKKEKQEILKAQQREKAAKESEKEARRLLKNFESLAEGEIEAAGISKEDRDIAAVFLGVNNPALDVDLSNKVKTKKVIKDGLKRFKTYLDARDKAVIEAYVSGKKQLPKVTSADKGSPPANGDKPIKNARDARKVFLANMLKRKAAG